MSPRLQFAAADRMASEEGLLAAYLRYSSDLQDDTSLADQLRKCREAAARLGCMIPDHLVFSDAAISGQSMHNRPGLQKFLEMARQTPASFQGVVVDDSSRLARNLEEVLRLYKILRHHNIYIHFAATGADSRSPQFEFGLIFAGMMDEQFLAAHRGRVRRGQEGQVKRGYNPGGRCYGYRNVRDEDPDRRGLHGHAHVKGCRQEVLPEQAAIVRLMFELRAGGSSCERVAKHLNAAGVQPPQMPRKKGIRSWCPSAIRDMLLNERYRGVLIYGRMGQEAKDPETGQKKRSRRPPSEWTVQRQEHLRIVSDELWDAVRAQDERVRGKHGPRQLGGMLRTETSRRYLFSGLLRCGVCEANIVIGSGKAPNAYYGCAYHRKRGVCGNKLTIKQRHLEEQLIGRLVAVLRAPEFEAEIQKEFARQVTVAGQTEAAKARLAVENQDELKWELADLHKRVMNLTEAIAENGTSPNLSAALRRHESRMVVIEQLLATRQKSPSPAFDPDEVEEFLRGKLDTLVEVLLGDPLVTKQELLKRIGKLVLTPEKRDGSDVFVVTGDLKLFAADDAMLGKSLEGIGEHCINLRVPLDGLVLYVGTGRRSRRQSNQTPCAHAISDELVTQLSGDSDTWGVLNEDKEPIWREVVTMDVEAFLRAVFSDIPKDQLSSAMPTWSVDSFGRQESNFEYRDGFGGLRLAGMVRELTPDVALTT